MEVNPLHVSLSDVIKPCERLVDYIKVYDDICDKELCDDIIKSFNSSEDHHKYIDRSQRPTFTEMNISERYTARDVEWMSHQKQVQSHFIESC